MTQLTASVKIAYDSLGRVISDKQTFDGKTRVTVNQKFTSYVVTQQKLPDGREISHTYDALYRRTQVGETGGPAIANWQFFGPTRVAEVKLAANAGGANLYCTYMNNDRTRSALQPGQTTPAWGNQSSDRLGYDAASRMTTKRYLLTDLDGNAYANTSAVMGQTTTYDRASNKLYERALHAESRSHLYSSPSEGEDLGEGVTGYDSVDRLRQYQRGTLATDGTGIDTPISLPNTNESRTYDLDGLGNWRRTSFTPVGGSETKEVRQHNALNQITSIKEGSNPKVKFIYDANGNLRNDGVRKYEYDAFNRLKKVYKTPSSPVLIAEYTYDALGRRIRKAVTNGGLVGSIPNGTTDYVYHSGIAQCCEERQEIATVDTPTKQYVWGIYIDELIQQKNLVALNNFSADIELYPLQDTLYRTTALADSAGALREAYDCDAYGNTLVFRKSGSPPSTIGWADEDAQVALPTCDFIFTGRRYDAETEIYFYRAREYAPQIGRFINTDPIEYVGGLNLYQLVASNPLTNVDPFGLLPPQEGPSRRRSALQNVKPLSDGKTIPVYLTNHGPVYGDAYCPFRDICCTWDNGSSLWSETISIRDKSTALAQACITHRPWWRLDSRLIGATPGACSKNTYAAPNNICDRDWNRLDWLDCMACCVSYYDAYAIAERQLVGQEVSYPTLRKSAATVAATRPYDKAIYLGQRGRLGSVAETEHWATHLAKGRSARALRAGRFVSKASAVYIIAEGVAAWGAIGFCSVRCSINTSR